VMLWFYNLTGSKLSYDNLELAMDRLERNLMDKEAGKSVRTNVIDFDKLAKNAESPIASLTSGEKNYLKERLGNLLEKNMAGASFAIQSATASATSSLLPTENAIKGLLEVQDRFKKMNSPWIDMASKFSGHEFQRSIVPKGFSGKDSLFDLVKRFESPIEKLKLQNFGMDSAVKSMTASTAGLDRFEEMKLTTPQISELMIPPRVVKEDLLPIKIDEAASSLNDLAVSLEKHFTEDKVVTEKQTKLLETLAQTAQMQMDAQTLHQNENREASRHSTKLAHLNIWLVVGSIVASSIVSFLIYWLTQKDASQLSQRPLTVHISKEDLVPLSEKLESIQKEVELLRKQSKKQSAR